MNALTEFDRQVRVLLQKGYSKLAGISEEKFGQLLETLKKKVASDVSFEVDLEQGKVSFVVVVSSSVIPVEEMMSRTEKDGQAGITKLFPHTSSDFSSLPDVQIPHSEVYLLMDIDRGKQSINLPPNEAMKLIKKADRSPLTIDEGVAIITHFPEFLIKNNCFSLLASRHEGDQRVPAIWINSQKQPNLGWCWDGNPHTWLGSASCKQRIAAG